MKALILAAGAGTRLKDRTKKLNKCMIPLYGRPLVEYSLETAASLPEIDEIVLVVGHRAEAIINNYGIGYRGKKIRYRIQNPLKGVVEAMNCARQDLEGQDFLLLLGDEIIPGGRYGDMIADFHARGLHVSCGVVRQSDDSRIRRTYAILQNEEGFIYRLVEKPERALNSWMGTGSCIFRNQVLDYSPAVPLHPVTKEKSLPDLVQCAVDRGHRVRSFDMGRDYLNVNTGEDLEEIRPGDGHSAGAGDPSSAR